MQKRLALISLLLVWILAVMLPPVINLFAESATVEITALTGEEESGESLLIDFFVSQNILEGSAAIYTGFDINNKLLSIEEQASALQIYQDIQVPPPKA
ncbi:hypothetical protein [Robiginitalea sp. IMCC43444]|uniref:hypothetical protein n=1 Tax=Robiginitalea sp. IMCC43444 TaxID=3459121 RepID=UPI004041758D